MASTIENETVTPVDQTNNAAQLSWGWLGAIVLSWVCLMYPLAVAGPLTLDEHASYWIIDSDLPGTIWQRSLDYAAIPPLSSYVQYLFLSAFGKTEFVFRLSSAVFGLAAFIVIYQTGREVANEQAGGIAALLLAWHPEALDEIRIARCYGQVLFLGALLLYATLRWQRRPQSCFLAIAWSLTATALLWTHYTSALLVIVTGLTVVATWIVKRNRNLATLIAFCLAFVMLTGLCWPLIDPLWRLKTWGEFLNYSRPQGSWLEIVSPLWWLGLPIGLLLGSVGAMMQKQTNGETARLPGHRHVLLTTGLCAIVPIAVMAWLASGELSSLANPRYRVAYAPAAACFLALILPSRNGWKLFTVIAVLLAAWIGSNRSPWELGRIGGVADENWRSVNQHLQDNAATGEIIFVQSGLVESSLVPAYIEDRQFMEYVACAVSRFYVDQPHARYALPFLWIDGANLDTFYPALLKDVSADESVWLAAATDTDLCRNSVSGMQILMSRAGFVPVETVSLERTLLIRYRRDNEINQGF